MDDESSVQAEFSTESTVEGIGPSHDQSTGAFFPQAQHFTVAGGQFNSIMNITHAASTLPSDFRMIPLGDLDLRNEIRSDSGVVYSRWNPMRSVRRMYSARIHDSKAPMTVALYQGENAEEEWRQDVSRYSCLRHPNILQLFGTVSSCGIHAAIFQDELILAKQVMEKYRGSHLATAYFWAYFDAEFWGAKQYMDAVSGNYLHPMACTTWIRPSTGRLCVDFTPPEGDSLIQWWYLQVNSPSMLIGSGLEPPEDGKIIDLIPLERYHEICVGHFSHYRSLPVSTNASVHLGVLIHCPHGSDIEHSKEIAYIPDLNFSNSGWHMTEGKPLSVMGSGWTRVNSWDVMGVVLSCNILCSYRELNGCLAQANHIFNRLGIASNHGDYVFVDQIAYFLRLYNTGDSIPSGYLFLCPLADLQSNTPSYFRHPECTAYWSLDPSGVERMSMEEAEQLGFPAFKLKMIALSRSWDESIYTGIRQFHQGKGFDPDSLDVARELGHPLFKISTEVDGPFAHLEEVEDCGGDSDYHEVSDETPSEAVHKESNLDSHLVREASCILDGTEVAEPCRTWRIVMGVQFALILTTTILWLHDLLRSRNLTNSYLSPEWGSNSFSLFSS